MRRRTGVFLYAGSATAAVFTAIFGTFACVEQYPPPPTTTGTTDAPDDAAEHDSTGTTDASGSGDASTGPPVTTDVTSSGTSSSSSDASTGELEPAPECGDGEVDPETEECDHGADNDDHGECTGSCKLNVCGDQHTHDGVEECDLGPANGDGSQCGGCLAETCQLGPHCGDDHIDVQCGELCDGSESPSGIPCTRDCRFDGAKIMFVTPSAYSGDLTAHTEHEVANGVEAADWICHDVADAAGLVEPPADNEPPPEPRFRAWLSGFEHAKDRLATGYTGLYVKRDGTTIAEGWLGLTSGTLLAPIDQGPDGEPLPGTLVWTNTLATGERNDLSLSCLKWQYEGDEESGGVGFNDSLEFWTYIPGEDGQSACDWKLHLYCIEQ